MINLFKWIAKLNTKWARNPGWETEVQEPSVTSAASAPVLSERERVERAAEWHEYQRDTFGGPNPDSSFHRIHDTHAHARRIDLKRIGHEEEMARTGKSFWEIHDIQEWARRAPSPGHAGWDDFWNELPTGSIAPLNELIKERKREERAREREFDRRWAHDRSDAAAARDFFNTTDMFDLRQMKAVSDLVDQAREILYKQGIDTVQSKALVEAAYEAQVADPTSKPDVNEIIDSAKRKMMTGRQGPQVTAELG